MYNEFVRTWLDSINRGAGVEFVATKMNMTVPNASAKANYLRKRGVNLPAMVRSKSQVLDVEKLNALIESKTN